MPVLYIRTTAQDSVSITLLCRMGEWVPPEVSWWMQTPLALLLASCSGSFICCLQIVKINKAHKKSSCRHPPRRHAVERGCWLGPPCIQVTAMLVATGLVQVLPGSARWALKVSCLFLLRASLSLRPRHPERGPQSAQCSTRRLPSEPTLGVAPAIRNCQAR